MSTMHPATIAEAIRIMKRLPTKYAALTALGITTGGRIGELLRLCRQDLIDPEKMELRGEIRIIQSKAFKVAPTQADKIDRIYNFIEIQTGNTTAEELENSQWQKIDRPRRNRYRHFSIPAEFRPYIEKHLNEEARRGHIHAAEYVFRGNKPSGAPLQTRAAYAAFRRLLGAGYGTHWLRKTYANFMYDTFKEQYGGDSFKAAREVQTLLGHKNIESTMKYLALDTMNRQEIVNSAFQKAFAAASRKRQPKPPTK